jgi:hypothetical protein
LNERSDKRVKKEEGRGWGWGEHNATPRINHATPPIATYHNIAPRINDVTPSTVTQNIEYRGHHAAAQHHRHRAMGRMGRIVVCVQALQQELDNADSQLEQVRSKFARQLTRLQVKGESTLAWQAPGINLQHISQARYWINVTGCSYYMNVAGSR